MEATCILETMIEAVEDEDSEDLELQSRPMYRIAFEEYLRAWLKTASTKAGVKRHESLGELIKCSKWFPSNYGIPGMEPDGLVQEKCQRRKRLKTHSERKWARVNQMRKIYQLCSTPDRLPPNCTAQMDIIRDPEMKECWESEVDKLVAWTHSLSFEDLDRQ